MKTLVKLSRTESSMNAWFGSRVTWLMRSVRLLLIAALDMLPVKVTMLCVVVLIKRVRKSVR
jgi:ABC-type glycerol-3-phosphate transport system permease component